LRAVEYTPTPVTIPIATIPAAHAGIASGPYGSLALPYDAPTVELEDGDAPLVYEEPRGIPFCCPCPDDEGPCCAKACGDMITIATKVRTPSIVLVCFNFIVFGFMNYIHNTDNKRENQIIKCDFILLPIIIILLT